MLSTYRFHLGFSLLFCSFFLFFLSVHAQPNGPGWTNEIVVQRYQLNGYPISMRFLPDGRLLIVQKHGYIMICDPENSQIPLYPSLFMTVPKVEYQWERGLIDLELDPDFSNNGHFYVYYNHKYNDSLARFRVSRFTTNSQGLGNPGTEMMIWEDDDNSLRYHAHYGGSLNFAPDSTLILTIGEKYRQAFAQDTSVLAGSVIRINRDGSIPSDNPLKGNNQGWREDIFAIGVRQPFRCYMDLPTGRFFISDVGTSGINVSWEDTHILQFAVPGDSSIVPDPPLMNFGHPLYEGYWNNLTPGNYPPGFPEPIHTYPHAGQEAAVIGGFIYRGNMLPAQYHEAYFYADYSRGIIRYLTFDSTGRAIDHAFAESPDPNEFFRPLKNIVSLVQSPSGAIYYINYTLKEVRRITYQPTNNQPPVCDSTYASQTFSSSTTLTTTFYSGTPSDPDGDSLQYNWIFGDGGSSTQPNPTHTYSGTGTYTAQLRIYDGTYTTACEPIVITLGDPPVATITSPANGYLFHAGEVITFSGTATDAQDGTLPGANMEWDIVFDHNTHTHTGLTGHIGQSGTFTIPNLGPHGFSENTGYTIYLKAIDYDGLTDTKSIQIFPNKVNLTLKTIPAGLTLMLDGSPVQDGHVIDEVIGYQYTVSTPLSQCSGGLEYVFGTWSDGGAASHTVTIPNMDDTLTVSFIATGTTCNDCNAAVSNGLMAMYDFSGNTGSFIPDISGVSPALDLTLEDPTKVSWVTGGLRFNSGTRAKSSINGTKIARACRASNAVTVEAWVEPANVTQGGSLPATLVSLSQRVGDRNVALTQRSNGTSGRWTAFLRSSGTPAGGTPEFDPNTWPGFSAPYQQHVVYTRDSLGIEKMYVNGFLVESGLKTGNFSVAWGWQDSAKLVVGNEMPGYNYPWLGTIYMLAIYSKALDSAGVVQNFNAGCGLPQTATFPVELLRFEGYGEGREAHLEWVSLTERNSAFFAVERSSPNEGYSQIGKVEALGNTPGETMYSFVDPQPHSGLNYYRLRMVDQDGHYSYSPVVALTFSGAPTFRIYPNPAHSEIYVQASALLKGGGSFSLQDVTGRRVFELEWYGQDSDVEKVDVSELPAGIYLYRFQPRSEGEGEEFSGKIVIR